MYVYRNTVIEVRKKINSLHVLHLSLKQGNFYSPNLEIMTLHYFCILNYSKKYTK